MHTPRRPLLAAIAALAWSALGIGAMPAHGAEGFASVSTGGNHTCGVTLDGSLSCWGYDAQGQSSPLTGAFTSVSAGASFTCGLRVDQTLACWGWNLFGQASPPAGAFKSVDAGALHACGVRVDDTVACWGYSVFGRTNAPPGSFRSVSAGADHSCGIRLDGSLTCWGSNVYRQATPPSGSFQTISAGSYASCGLRTDGTLACWGRGAAAPELNPTPGTGMNPPLGTFTAISAGPGLPCALGTNGWLKCWGLLREGQSPPPPGPFLAVDGFCGVRTSHAVACWGDNSYGQSDPPGGIPPTTTISLSPAHPNGLNGWYVSPVHVTVSASDDAAGPGVAETRCARDQSLRPTRFEFISTNLPCPFTGAGLDVTWGPFEHVVYAASRDLDGNVEAVKLARFKIDPYQPFVHCSVDPAVLWPPDRKLIDVHAHVTVWDYESGPAGFRLESVTTEAADGVPHDDLADDVQDWDVGTADVDGELRAEGPRVYTLRYRGYDQAGNSWWCAATVSVPRSAPDRP